MKYLIKILSLVFILSLMAACVPAEEKAEEQYEIGRKIFHTNDPRGALVVYEKGLEYMPTHARLLYESGNCYMNFRDYVTAIEFYTKAIKSNPNYADAYNNRGESWFYLNDKIKSCTDWQKAHDLGKPNLLDKLKHCN